MTARHLDVTPDEYHGLPFFSATFAKILLSRSALHAKAAIGLKPSTLLDRGAVIHRLVLGKGKDYQIIEADDWRTNKAKAEREAARKAGLVPVLAHQFADYSEAAAAITTGLADRGIYLDGASEYAIGWDEGDVQCKGMLDHVWLDTGVILDLKITGNAAPDVVERSAENLGYAIQSAAYTRALGALRPNLLGRIKFLFAFCEPDAPHAMNICRADGTFLELGGRRWQRAHTEWARCLASGEYPGYDAAGINDISPPGWALAKEGYPTND